LNNARRPNTAYKQWRAFGVLWFVRCNIARLPGQVIALKSLPAGALAHP